MAITENLIVENGDKVAAAVEIKNNDVNQQPESKIVTREKGYWDEFYSKKFDVAVPSQFCVLVATEASKNQPFVEFGCGNGRDSHYMARQGFQVHGSDLSAAAIKSNQATATERENRAEFMICDVANAQQVQDVVKKARGEGKGVSGNVTLYNRFFLHTLDDNQERIFLKALSEASVSGDKLYMEFRCSLDASLDKEYGKGHFRRYVQTDDLETFLESIGFNVQYRVTGRGMAKYKAEDPFVSRIICIRK